MHYVSFPGLGIPEIKLEQIAFEFGSFRVAWYGLILTLGIVCAFLYVYLMSKKDKLIFDDLLDIAMYTVVFAVVCARIYYVVFDAAKNPQNYKELVDYIAIWRGGIAVYGSILGGFIASFIVLKIKKINILKFYDYLTPAVMLGQIIGRWGNFVNAEAYGGTTDIFCRMVIRFESGATISVHPTFLYESLWNLVGFLIINLVISKRKRFEGQLTYTYFAWYGFGRMFIEGLRSDSLYIGIFRVSQLVGFACFVIFGLLIVYKYIKTPKPQLAECIYKKESKHYKATMEALAADPKGLQENEDDEDNEEDEEEDEEEGE